MTKLYMFEGVPGSGKTSSAKWLASRLEDKAKLFLEGDPQHPADYESVACLTEEQVITLEQEYPLIHERMTRKGERSFISYMGLYEEERELFDRLKAFDVYELPVEDYLRLPWIGGRNSFSKQGLKTMYTYWNAVTYKILLRFY
jgi:Cdc6-like AAA superfamily ATPase